jgi:hypothetical protein
MSFCGQWIEWACRRNDCVPFMCSQQLHTYYYSVGAHNGTPQSVGLLWMSDRPVAHTSTWQHSQETSMPVARFELAIPRLRPPGHLDRQEFHARFDVSHSSLTVVMQRALAAKSDLRCPRIILVSCKRLRCHRHNGEWGAVLCRKKWHMRKNN